MGALVNRFFSISCFFLALYGAPHVKRRDTTPTMRMPRGCRRVPRSSFLQDEKHPFPRRRCSSGQERTAASYGRPAASNTRARAPVMRDADSPFKVPPSAAVKDATADACCKHRSPSSKRECRARLFFECSYLRGRGPPGTSPESRCLLRAGGAAEKAAGSMWSTIDTQNTRAKLA